jgi:hypothetical protein
MGCYATPSPPPDVNYGQNASRGKSGSQAGGTFDFVPDARARDLGDSKWEVIPADSLAQRQGAADGPPLYLAAQTGIYALWLNVAGAGALPRPSAWQRTEPERFS